MVFHKLTARHSRGAQKQLESDLRSGDTAAAMHTIEDAYASGHAGFQYWPGGLPTLSHDYGDWFPSNQVVGNAASAATQFLLDMDANLNQLNSGNPVDTAKYFPPNPCGS
jgi:hypothetical protein